MEGMSAAFVAAGILIRQGMTSVHREQLLVRKRDQCGLHVNEGSVFRSARAL